MNELPATPTPTSPLLTLKEQADIAAKREDARLARLGHAVAFLNNHLPRYGPKDWPYPADHESWKGAGDAAYYLGPVPEEVKPHLTRAMVNAAKFVAAEFATGDPEPC